MRSAVHTAFGDPAELLHLGDMPVPEPGPGQVRVRTLLSPIHNHDLWTVRGEYGYKPDLPAIGGSEAVGVVEAVGEGADAGLIGRRVAVAGVHGTWAEAFIAPTGAQVVELGVRNATIHQVDEKVELDDLGKLAQIYEGILENLLLD